MFPSLLSTLLLLASPATSSPLFSPQSRRADDNTNDGVSTSNAFHILVVPSDPSSSSSSSAIGTLTPLHTGAGQNRAGITYDASSAPIIFYLNATGPDDGVIVHDVLPVGYPLRLLVGDPAAAPSAAGNTDDTADNTDDTDAEENGDGEEGLQAVHLTVSGASTIHVSADPPLLAYEDGGSFWVCEESDDPFLPSGTYTVLEWWSGDDDDDDDVEGPAGCERVELVPVCGELEGLPEGAVGSHEFVEEVACFVSRSAVERAFGL